MTNRISIERFVFHTHKPKAEAIAQFFKEGCTALGYDCIVTDSNQPVKDRVGVFYGVIPSTYAAFQFYKAERRAVYLDNGWLSTRELPTLRYTWNGVQSFLRDMEPVRGKLYFPDLPEIDRKPQNDLALLILQSRAYFDNLSLGYSRDVWERATTRLLTMKGYRVETREKPQKRGPQTEDFFEQIARAGIVVSLNSASCIKALRYGIPAYCTLDCTLSPYAPVKLPNVGMAAPPPPEDVMDLMRRVAQYEKTKKDFTSGRIIESLLAVPQEKRRGMWYGTR